MAISKSDVFNACSELSVQGRNVTLDAVRAITGGSFSTISPLVKEWKAEQSGVNASLESSIARTDVPEKLTELFNTLWSSAMAEASRKLEAQRQLLNDYKTELENERHELIYASDRIASELDDLKFDFSVLNTNYKALQELHNNFERENISLRAELEARSKIIASNELVLGELTRFLKSFNDTASAAPSSAIADKVSQDAPTSDKSSVNSDMANKNESKSAPFEIKSTSKAVSKAKNKATTKKNATAGNAPGSSLPVRGKTVAGNIITLSSGAVT